MTRKPIDLAVHRSIVDGDLKRCSADLQRAFAGVAFDPMRWTQPPWGDQVGGFWALAAKGEQVLWYNDIEGGFSVSRFVTWGSIPDSEYWCNQDDLCTALNRLMSE